LDWALQEHLDTDKVDAFLICLLHYILSINHTMWVVGNNCTGTYCNIFATTATLCSHNINEAMLAHYTPIMTISCPNHFNTCTRQVNGLLYW
jgi:hypothetical protein